MLISFMRLPSALESEVFSRTSMPRVFRCSTTPSAWSSETSGMIRPMASTSTMRASDWARRGFLAMVARMMSSISAMVSMPAKPPPTTTKVRARRFSSASVMVDAASMRSRIWLRRASASSMAFRPMPASARPGMGKVRVVAPAVITMSWYGISNSVPSSVCTVAVLRACSTFTTLPITCSEAFRCVRRSTTAWRGSM